MTEHYAALERREPAIREAELFSLLPDVRRRAMAASAYAKRLRGHRSRRNHWPGRAGAPAAIVQVRPPRPAPGRPALPRVYRGAAGRSGGYSRRPARSSSLSPRTPIPGAAHGRCSQRDFGRATWWLNTFSYHLTPGGFIFDASVRALGCAVIPAGPGNTETQFELIEAYRPVGYSGTPDFLKSCWTRLTAPGATSRRSGARWCRVRRFRSRCSRRSVCAASMPIRRSAPPISA
jgi:phenylacetate-CoA ligase